MDNATGEIVILKGFTITGMEIWDAAKEEAATLQKLRKSFLKITFFRNIFFEEHKNVVRFIAFLDRLVPEWNQFCSMCFIAMEHCGGGSLVNWLAKMKASGRQTTAAEAGVIGAQLVSALSYCHVREVGHFDLKPGNVFIMPDFIEVNRYFIK